jgi:hypothetical protein
MKSLFLVKTQLRVSPKAASKDALRALARLSSCLRKYRTKNSCKSKYHVGYPKNIDDFVDLRADLRSQDGARHKFYASSNTRLLALYP